MGAIDGHNLQFPDDSFDIVQTCYVLHHLGREHADALLDEMVRVARKRVLILEDSMPDWTLPYRIRNWAHLTESNLLYEDESDDFVPYFSAESFLDHQTWLDKFGALDDVESVRVDTLDQIKRYAHHTLFVLELSVNP